MTQPSFVEKVRAAVGHITAARNLMSSGPLDYYLVKLCEHSEALLTRFSPIKTGGRAVIVREVKCNGGWAGCERTLAVGSVGTVSSVDYRDGVFMFDFVPDHQWWKDSSGEWQRTERQNSYCLSEHSLAPIIDAGERQV